MRENKNIKLLLWFLLLFFYLFLNILFASLIHSLNIHSKLLLNIIYIICEVIIAGVLIFLYKNDFKDKFKALKSKEGNEAIKKSIKAWLYGLFFMVMLNIIIGYFVGDLAENESGNREVISKYSYYAFITMIITTPICEEIVFRLASYKIFDNKYLYIIFSGLLFGFAHVIGTTGLQTLYILPYTALGISFAYIYQKYQNIYCSILMHSMHNLLCITMILFI